AAHQGVFSFLTSASIVVPAICCADTGFASSASVSLPRTPSLKPFTAPPRSCPMLRSFFVPKISTTTSNTISQCQMLKPPMMFSSVLVLAARQHSPERFRSADDVQVDVHHLLPSDASGVD